MDNPVFSNIIQIKRTDLDIALKHLKSTKCAISEGLRVIESHRLKADEICYSYLTFFTSIEESSVLEVIKTCEENILVSTYLKENKETYRRTLRLRQNHFDDVCSRIDDIVQTNKVAARCGYEVLCCFNERRERISMEQLWASQSVIGLDLLMKKALDMESSIGTLENQVSILIEFLDNSQKRPQNCEEQYKQWMVTSSKHCKIAREVLAEISGYKEILADKYRLCHRYTKHYEEFMTLKLNKVYDLQKKVSVGIDKLNKRYDIVVKKDLFKAEISMVNEEKFSLHDYLLQMNEKLSFDYSFILRKSLFNNIHVLAPVRTQGPGDCSYNATLTATESLHKIKFALHPMISDQYEFTVELSREHLKDIVQDFLEQKSNKNLGKLDACFLKMKTHGVVSEDAYVDPVDQDFTKYKIAGFEEVSMEDIKVEESQIFEGIRAMEDSGAEEEIKPDLNESIYHVVCEGGSIASVKDHLRSGKVLVASFKITKDYYSLKPHDIYEIPREGVKYELSGRGIPWGHAVVIVGFGVKDGRNYFIFQNSYGRSWGLDGFGRVYVDSVKQLYKVDV